jgi:hypothetical protein
MPRITLSTFLSAILQKYNRKSRFRIETLENIHMYESEVFDNMSGETLEDYLKHYNLNETRKYLKKYQRRETTR